MRGQYLLKTAGIMNNAGRWLENKGIFLGKKTRKSISKKITGDFKPDMISLDRISLDRMVPDMVGTVNRTTLTGKNYAPHAILGAAGIGTAGAIANKYSG